MSTVSKDNKKSNQRDKNHIEMLCVLLSSLPIIKGICMATRIVDDINRLSLVGRDAVSRVVSLTHAHLNLLEIELKEQTHIFIKAAIVAAFIVVTGGVSLVLFSFALSGAIRTMWPSIGEHTSLAIIGVANIFLMISCVLWMKNLIEQLSPLCLETIRLWKESLSSALRNI